MRNRTGSPNHLDAKHRIFVNVGCGREIGDNVCPVGIEFIREYQWQSRLYPLTKLETINLDHDFAIGPDIDECIRWINFGLGWRLRALLRQHLLYRIRVEIE